MSLVLRPVSLADARRYIAEHHSHNGPPQGWKFGVRVEIDGVPAGVGIAGRPQARGLDNGTAIEITRVCTIGVPNACSKIYGALTRAAAALGYTDAWTYTLKRECAACVKASGFVADAELPERGSWDTPARPRVATDLFGEERTPVEAKIRWHRVLGMGK